MAGEFPHLPSLGLYAADIRGDGNCLFNALSDQVFGDQSHHQPIRARVIDFMREHAEYYKGFLDVQPGGGTRRNPKRKNTGAYSTPVSNRAPTAQEIDQAFEQHITRMARGGTWGDNMEIVAFAAAHNCDVRIYMSDYSYMVPGQGEESSRGIAHIAYHDWEHYSSIRNIDGPHSGLPQVKWKNLAPEEETELAQRAVEDVKKSYVLPWKVKAVSNSLPFITDNTVIKNALEQFKGNVDDAVSMLIEADDVGSVSSTQGSSSVERDADSDDEDDPVGPKKRAARNRLARATRNLMKDSQHRRAEMAARLRQHDGSQESVNQAVANLEIPDSKESSPAPFNNDSDDWVPSRSGTPDPSGLRGPTRLKINVKTDASKVGKTHVRSQGPRPRNMLTARERKEMKKRQQKDARKVRAQQDAKLGSATDKENLSLPGHDKLNSSPAPVIVEGHMRTLYI